MTQASFHTYVPVASSVHSGLFLGGNILPCDGLHMYQLHKVQAQTHTHTLMHFHGPVQVVKLPQEVEQQAPH